MYFCVCVFVCLWTQAHVPRYATVRQERTVCASILCALPSHGMLCAHPFHHFHLRAAPQGLPSPQPGSRRHSPSQISRRRPGSFSTQGQDPSYLRDQGWVQSRECSFEKAPCIIYQIFRIRVPNRSGSAWPSKGILDVHNLGSEDDVQLWNPCCSLRAS